MNFFCLHHSPAIDRKEYLLDTFNQQKITVDWIEDFLPSSKTILQHEKVHSIHAANGEFLNSAEISCFKKHVKAIEIIAQSEQIGVIFEDDIENPNFNLKPFCESAAKVCCENTIIFIGSYSGADLINYNNECRVFFSPNFKSRCAHAYMLNSQTAKNILPELSKIILPFDWQLNHIIDKLNLNIGWTSPHINQRTEKGKLKSLLR